MTNGENKEPYFVTMTEEERHKYVDRLLVTLDSEKDVESALFDLGTLIDVSEDLERLDGLTTAISYGDVLLQRSLDTSSLVEIHYFLANAWEGVRRHSRKGTDIYEWEQPEQSKQIIHLRKAILLAEDAKLTTIRICEVLTNLANLMSHCGRYVDAIAYWDQALAIDQDFAMALGNRAAGLIRYAELIHDQGHQVFHLREAYTCLIRALKVPLSHYPIASTDLEYFATQLKFLTSSFPEKIFEPLTHQHQFREDASNSELAYRHWCLKERLFLNDLNDLGEDPYAAADVLTLPSLSTPINAPRPNAIGFFNQIKHGLSPKLAPARLTF